MVIERADQTDQGSRGSMERSFIGHPRRSGDTQARRVGDDTLIIHLQLKQYHILNSIAGRIWELSDGSRSVDDIVAAIAAEFDADPSIVREDVVARVEAALATFAWSMRDRRHECATLPGEPGELAQSRWPHHCNRSLEAALVGSQRDGRRHRALLRQQDRTRRRGHPRRFRAPVRSRRGGRDIGVGRGSHTRRPPARRGSDRGEHR